MTDLNARDAQLVRFLNEAYAKEAELEADLTAHIALTQKRPYKKKLQQHLKETRDHKRRIASRINALGGRPTAGPQTPGAVPAGVGEAVGKGVAAVKGQVGVARAAVTDQSETHLRNAREELREEYVEIGLYTAIEALADAVGDRETAQLAKSIRRDEQRVASYLERLIPQLTRDLARSQIPASLRAPGARRRSTPRRSSAASRRPTGARKSTTARSRTTSGRRSRSGSR
jgi:ferritin-like metal-binding protein YciE